MAADDDLVLAPRDDRIDEPELADGAGERVELGVGDAPGVGGIGAQVVDRYVDDRELLVNGLHLEVPQHGAGVGGRLFMSWGCSVASGMHQTRLNHLLW